MVDIKDTRIQKSTYQFGVKKRYSSELKYKTVERTPLQKIQETIAGLRKPKAKLVLEEEEEKRGGAPAEGEEAKKKPAGKPLLGGKLILKAVGGIALFLLLMAALVLFFQSMVTPGELIVNEPRADSLSVEFVEYDILTASNENAPKQPYHTAFARLSLQGSETEALPVRIIAYDSVAPSSVYILRSHRYQAESYPEFIISLREELSSWQVPLNEIGMAELAAVPSQSLVIVPSGYIPEEMLTEKDTRLTELLTRGVTVMYMGQPFYRMYSKQGAVVSSNPNALAPMRVIFDEINTPLSTSNFSLRSPLYTITTGGIQVFGSVSAMPYGAGHLVALPQTLDGGWESGTEAAHDVARLVVEMPWLSPAGTNTVETPVGANVTLLELYTSIFEGDSKYVHIYGFDKGAGQGFSKVIYMQKSTNGELYTDGHEILPSGLDTTRMDLLADLQEEGGEERLFFQVTRMLDEVDREPIATTKVALNSRPTFPYEFILESGDYILNIVDADGKAYARSYMRVGMLEIRQLQHYYSSDTYRFAFYLDGELTPVTGSVYVDDFESNPLEFENVQYVEMEAAQLAGGPLAANEYHTFIFSMGEYTTELRTYKYGSRSLFTDPLFLGAIGVGAIALGIGFLFAKKGATFYGLDIPDFPPQSTKKIPMSKETLLGIFQKINERYKWKNTPLTLSEVKGGFRGILHEGNPIFISDYNLEYLLFRLMGMGLIKRELSYYGLVSWEKETGNTVRHLASFRKLRDVCINNAIPFTPLGTSTDYDSKITIIGQEIYVHLYDVAGRVIPNALTSLKSGLNIILFEEEAEKSEFYEYLSSGYAEGTTLKLEIQAGSVLLKTWDEFSAMVKEMKV